MISKRYNEQMGNYIAKLAEKQNTAIGYVPPLKKTNADRIRAMTDEKLVKHLACQWKECKNMDVECDKCLLDWLKQEVSANDS